MCFQAIDISAATLSSANSYANRDVENSSEMSWVCYAIAWVHNLLGWANTTGLRWIFNGVK